MSSKLDLANQALLLLGKSPLSSLDESDDLSSIAMADIINDAIRFVIVDGKFKSCVRHQLLNMLPDCDHLDYDYAFQLPTNPFCLKVLTIQNNKGYSRYIVEGDVLYTDHPTQVQLTYLADMTDVGSNDIMLKKAVVARLMADLAMTVGLSAAAEERLEMKYENVMKKVRPLNAQQDSAKQTNADDLIDVR